MLCNVIIDLDEMKERLRTGWAKLDHVVIAAVALIRRLSACVKAGGVALSVTLVIVLLVIFRCRC